MKKTGLCLVLVLTAALLFASCGSDAPSENGASGTVSEPARNTEDNGNADNGTEVAASSIEAPQAVWTMTLDNGVEIPFGGAADGFLSSLGDPTDLMEAPSCIREGFDRVYTYGGAFTITTAPAENGTDIVTEANLLSDAVAVVENGVTVMIGSPVFDADAAFGEPSDATEFVRRYPFPGGTLTVTASNGEITGISAGIDG